LLSQKLPPSLGPRERAGKGSLTSFTGGRLAVVVVAAAGERLGATRHH